MGDLVNIDVDATLLVDAAREVGGVAGKFGALLSRLEEGAAQYEGREGDDDTGRSISRGYNPAAANLKGAVKYVRDQLLQYEGGLKDAAGVLGAMELANEAEFS
ncbi:hypothetical protein OHB12_12485 [Nocardia sp. NBC_01730]|uniref:hypothetical protein n=1 Tax=Nocardia sp. NBC_01730 TaxID=2975998 RepID=UPI002E1573EC|nr:hypothetical protein OHB12_12485 [Nocardia sp. NBC_01730]